MTRGTTYENRANLAPAFLGQIVCKYQGTRLGPQELEAELFEDVPGALWNGSVIGATRACTAPALIRMVVAIDPAASSTDGADQTGIVVVGKDEDGRRWVLTDASGRYQPTGRAKIAISAYRADRIVAEVNNGGDMVDATLRMTEPNASLAAARASRGKVTRAKPVAALYEQGGYATSVCFLSSRAKCVRSSLKLMRLPKAAGGLLAESGRCARMGIGRPPGRTDTRGGVFTRFTLN